MGKHNDAKLPLLDAIDLEVLKLAAEYVQIHRAAMARNKDGYKSSYAVGAEVHRAWKGAVESKLATDQKFKQMFDPCQTSTGVAEHAGHPKLFDLRLKANGNKEVCIEVQASGSGPHKPSQKQAQRLYLTQVASGPVVVYTVTASTHKGPQLTSASSDDVGRRKDLSAYLCSRLK